MKTPNHISLRRSLSISGSLGFIGCLVTALCLPFGAMLAADDGPAAKNPPTNTKLKKKSESEAKTVITGSLIPQKVKPDRIPVTTSPVIVISRTDIERSGATTLSEVLKRQGASR